MITKIEIGASGARFPVIERLARALEVDPAELFSTEIPSGAINRKSFAEISSRLATLSEPELMWLAQLIDAALSPRVVRSESSASARPSRLLRKNEAKPGVSRASRKRS